MHRESTTRSIVKTASYRFIATVVTAALVYLFTGKWILALAVGSIDVMTKLVLFFLHERIWNKVSWGRHTFKPVVLWFTGLSGSGKTSLSTLAVEALRAKGLKVEHLDGDRIRALFPKTGFSRESRMDHVQRLGLLASYLQKNGVCVVTSVISPYADSRAFVRNLCENFIEIHVSTPLAICESRDVKGLYAKARRGEIKNFTGIDDPYEVPLNPEIEVDASTITPEEGTKRVMSYVEKLI